VPPSPKSIGPILIVADLQGSIANTILRAHSGGHYRRSWCPLANTHIALNGAGQGGCLYRLLMTNQECDF
jgi:hypothetical protein